MYVITKMMISCLILKTIKFKNNKTVVPFFCCSLCIREPTFFQNNVDNNTFLWIAVSLCDKTSSKILNV